MTEAYARPGKMSDEDVLECLWLRDHHGWTMKDIGLRFGRTKNAIIGVLNRVDKAAKTEAVKPHGRTGDGTMVGNWWKR